MTSITNIQFSLATLQAAGQGGRQNQAGFEAMLSCFDCDKKHDEPKKAGYAGSLLDIDFSVFGMEDDGRNGNDLILGLIDELFEKIRGTLGGNCADAAKTQGAYTFPFSSAFQDIFGTNGGPLFSFIHETTARLGLSPEKNLALQNIAIHNKDVVKSPETVQKIAQELKEAGIG